VYTYSELHVYKRLLVEIRGNHGTNWKKQRICLPEGTYQLAFVATHGLQFLSDIALDNIKLNADVAHHQHCLSVKEAVKGKHFTDCILSLFAYQLMFTSRIINVKFLALTPGHKICSKCSNY